MKFRALAAAIAAGFLILTAAAGADDRREKQELVVEIMKATNLNAIARHMHERAFQSLSQRIRSKYPNVKPQILDIVSDVLRQEFDSFADELVPFTADMMVREFTLEDLKVLEAFYRSPTGQKSIAAMPSIVQQSLAFSQSWLRQSRPRIEQALRERLAREGIDI